ncbi:Transposon Ty3-G Gag-Pol polyprotein [Penaeus vannamei]|uniref:Transposon Ty3-G Gag-Pol polyprotein n=1 Tax=Penaeus vannamei TaxID=6689 RepID=A0A3R7MKK3_PENVA|nr:Transposon Ty3-G Gag-Pol polyprotein [Penaeus vannamei]
MNKDIKQWARCCVACQMSKVSRHTESGTGEFRQPMRRFGHLHVDVVGPLPPSDGAQYLFTATERSTRWPEAIPMQHTTARDCAEALLHGWISRFGVPDDITDRGPAFTSQLWTSLGELMGSTIHHTTSYNPEANGMVERSHRTLKAALMARCTKSDWKAQLPWVLLGIRTSPKEGLQVSPAEMVFGEALTVPGEFFPSLDTPTDSEHLTKLRHAVEKYRPCTQTHSTSPSQYLPKLIHSCKYVFVRNDAHRSPLTRPYRGPYAVLERNPKAYRLSIGGKSDWVSIDLKACIPGRKGTYTNHASG